jgi:hypothetical protein
MKWKRWETDMEQCNEEDMKYLEMKREHDLWSERDERKTWSKIRKEDMKDLEMKREHDLRSERDERQTWSKVMKKIWKI